jgi:hypothetical protein
MKTIAKIFVILILINFIVSVGILGYTTFTLVGQTLNGTGIKLTDLVTNKLTKEQYALVTKRMDQNSQNFGKITAEKFEGIFSNFMPKTVNSEYNIKANIIK